jgi:hypothetical protein
VQIASDNGTRKYSRYLRGFAILLAVALVAYLTDYLLLRFRNPQVGSVTVHRFYRIPQKNGKVDIQYDGDYAHECVHSLLPHSGDKPCWYLSRKTEEWIDINSGTANNPHIF